MTGDNSKAEGGAVYKYFAFISYSRKDSKVAAWLQKRLEWFRFPVKLVPQDRRPPNPKYIRPVYRDKTNLEVTDEHYWTNIRRALEKSRFLIVLCSPASAHQRSDAPNHPVNMEVEYFLETHDQQSRHIVPVILGGSVTSSGEDAAFCPILRELGDNLIGRNLPSMVPDTGGSDQEAWELGFVAIISYLLKLDRDAVGSHIQSETRKQAKSLRRWLYLVSTLALIAVFAGVMAKLNADAANEAKKQINLQLIKNETLMRETIKKDISSARKYLASDDWEQSMGYYLLAAQKTPIDAKLNLEIWSTLLNGKRNTARPPVRSFRQASGYSPVGKLCYSGNGKLIAAGTGDGMVEVWNISEEKQISSEIKHPKRIHFLEFNHDDTLICSVSSSRAIVSSVVGENPLFSQDGFFISAAIDKEKKRLAMGSNDGDFYVLNLDKMTPERCILPDQSITALTFEGETLYAAVAGGEVYEYDLATKQLKKILIKAGENIWAIKSLPEGRLISNSSTDDVTKIQIWDKLTGKLIAESSDFYETDHLTAISPDGSMVASGGFGFECHFGNTFQPRDIRAVSTHQDVVTVLNFSPSGRLLISGSVKDGPILYDTLEGNVVGLTKCERIGALTATFSPQEDYFAVGYNDGTIAIYSCGSCIVQEQMPFDEPEWVRRTINSGWSVYADQNGVLNLKNAQENRWVELPAIILDNKYYESVDSISESGSVAILQKVKDNGINYIDLVKTRSGEVLWSTKEEDNGALVTAFISRSTNAAHIVSSDSIRVIGMDGSLKKTINFSNVAHKPKRGSYRGMRGIVLSENEDVFAYLNENNEIVVWSVESEEPITVVWWGQDLSQFKWSLGLEILVAFSADSKLLAIATPDTDNGVHVLTGANFKTISKKMKHRFPVGSIQFTGDSSSLITTSGIQDDTFVPQWKSKLYYAGGECNSWSIKGPEITLTNSFHYQPEAAYVEMVPDRSVTILDAALSDDSSLLTTFCENGTIGLWDFHTGDQLGPFVQVHRAAGPVKFWSDSLGVWVGTTPVRFGFSEPIPINDIVSDLEMGTRNSTANYESINQPIEKYTVINELNKTTQRSFSNLLCKQEYIDKVRRRSYLIERDPSHPLLYFMPPTDHYSGYKKFYSEWARERGVQEIINIGDAELIKCAIRLIEATRTSESLEALQLLRLNLEKSQKR